MYKLLNDNFQVKPMDRDSFKKHKLLMHSDRINKYLMNRINGFVSLIIIALILNIFIYFDFNSLNFLFNVENRLELMVFILTVILVDATLSLLSFTYILVIKDDQNSMDFKGTEIVSDKSAGEISYLIKNWKDGLKNKSKHLQSQKKKLLEFIDKIGTETGNSDLKSESTHNRHEKRSDIYKLREIDRDSRMPTYVIESKLIGISDDLKVFDDDLEELERNEKNHELKSSVIEARDLYEKLKDLENELLENLTLLEYSMEIYNFKTLKIIGKLFFQSSISIIIGFFILGILTFALQNDTVFTFLQSFGNMPLQIIVFFASIFLIDGSWSFLRAVYSFFKLYIRD